MTIDRNDEPDVRSEEQNNSRKIGKGYSDPSGTYPLPGSLFQSSLSKANRGKEQNTLNIGGGYRGLSVELPPQGTSIYPHNRAMKTASGHSLEFDDTPGAERILIKHTSGSGTELRSDGSVVTKTEKNSITSIAGSSCIIIDGDSDIQVSGNLNLNVTGDMNISVGGNLSIETGGGRIDSVGGNTQEKYYGDKVTNVSGDNSEVVCGGNLGTYLGGNTDIIKGNNKTLVQGESVTSVTGTVKITSNVMQVSANSGVIGGDGVTYIGRNFFGSFIGDVDGVARWSQFSSYYVNGRLSTQIPGYYNDGHQPELASIVSVSIDSGDYIKASLDKPMSVADIRSELRSGVDISSDVVSKGINTGTLSPASIQQIPPAIERISGRKSQNRIAQNTSDGDIKRIRATKNITTRKYVPDPFYDVNNISGPISLHTKLSKDIKFNKFVWKLEYERNTQALLQLMRQYQLYVDPIGIVSSGEFVNHRLTVAEGLYQTQSVLGEDHPHFLASKGRQVAFELFDERGKVDLDKTFDLATYWRDTINYDKLSLNYDLFDPKGVTCQIVLIMPELDVNYNLVTGSYQNQIETFYNAKSQAQELVKFG